MPEPGHDGHFRRAGIAAAAGGYLRLEPGRSRVADLARRTGFAVIVCAPAAEQGAFGDADRRIEGYALPVEDAGARYVVVSTQGRGDEAALLAALAVDADYVAFVGSRKKAEALKATLARRSSNELIRRATDDRTRAYYAETLPNPKLTVFPIAEVAAIGRSFGIPLVMDNTAAPILARPFAHGAAVVVYSTTKYLGGYGNSVGGLIVDGGNFD